MTGPSGDLLSVLERREGLLQCMHGGVVDKSDLVERLDISRSTVDRSVRNLERRGIVERGGDGYRLTLLGRLLLNEYERFAERVDSVRAAADVLSVLPPDADVPVSVLKGAEVVTADRTQPYRPLNRHEEFIERAERVQVVATAYVLQYVDIYRDLIVESGMAAEMAFPPEIVERLVSEHRDVLDETLATGRLDLRELSTTPPFSIVVVDLPERQQLGLLVHVPDGIRGYVTNDRSEAVEWGRERFRDHWEAADSLTFTD